MIGQEEFKLMQYADDLTLFVPNIECVQLILQLLDRFTFCSGLKVNHTKTEAMWVNWLMQTKYSNTSGAEVEQKCQGSWDSFYI